MITFMVLWKIYGFEVVVLPLEIVVCIEILIQSLFIPKDKTICAMEGFIIQNTSTIQSRTIITT